MPAMNPSDAYTDYGEILPLWKVENGRAAVTGDVGNWFSKTICFANDMEDYIQQEARYLAIIYEEDNEHVEAVLDIMAQSFPNVTDEQAHCIVHPEDDTNGNCTAMLKDLELERISEDSVCSDWNSLLPFAEGWTLRFFHSEDEFNDFIARSQYGVGPYSTEPDGTVDTTTPIGAAIVFEVNDDGSQWDYTIRGEMH